MSSEVSCLEALQLWSMSATLLPDENSDADALPPACCQVYIYLTMESSHSVSASAVGDLNCVPLTVLVALLTKLR